MLSDAELHGLVDGQIAVHHRSDILRRAAASPDDRRRISSWQTQGEMIRSVFGGIDREPLPHSLDLRAPARPQAIAPERETAHPGDVPPILVAEHSLGRSPRFGSMPALGFLQKPVVSQTLGAALLTATLGLAAAWLVGGLSPAVTQSAGPDEVLARRASGESSSGADAALPAAAPASAIPDLSSLGFSLTAADVQLSAPASIVFHYRNVGGEQVTLGISRSEGATTGSSPAALVGTALVWHAGTRAYALAGDRRSEQLRAMVPAVRALALQE